MLDAQNTPQKMAYELFVRKSFEQRDHHVTKTNAKDYILLSHTSYFQQSNIVNVKAAVAYAIATYNATTLKNHNITENYDAFVIEVFNASTLEEVTDIISRYKQATNLDNLTKTDAQSL